MTTKSANAGVNLLTNGNLDQTQPVLVVAPAFFLPKPAFWVNEGFRVNTGPYEGELSSEPWAGPAPTPVTTDGSGLPSPNGCDGLDCAVFFKPFSGDPINGAATGNLYQDLPASPGQHYELTGWAGAEANFLGQARFALDFLNGGGGLIGSGEIDLIAAGLFVNNGQPFNYKQYTIGAIAPAGTQFVRARASMLNGTSNPAGGGQAFVVDDFELNLVPEPATLGLVLLGGAVLARRRSRA